MPRKISELATPKASMNLGTEPEELEVSGVTSVGSEPEDTSVEPEGVEDEEGALKESEEVLSGYASTPHGEWLEELGAINVASTEAAAIMDKIMSMGKYEETYRIGGQIVRIRTRTTVDADRTIEILQDQRPESTAVYSHLVSRINLASSLVQYGDNKFPYTDPADDNRALLDTEWRTKYRFCASLPAPAFYALSQVLQKFDAKVSLSCDARSLENF